MITIAHNYIEPSAKWGPGNYWYSWRSTGLDMKIQKTSDGKFYRALPSNEKIKHYFVYKKSTEINQGYVRS